MEWVEGCGEKPSQLRLASAQGRAKVGEQPGEPPAALPLVPVGPGCWLPGAGGSPSRSATAGGWQVWQPS